MNQDYIKPDAWSIIEEGFDPSRVKSSESLFSIGNGAMGQRANFEEDYTGPTFQGSYIAGVYYPDKTRVGWWKNGYPEYFAKVLNAPNWIGIKVKIDDEVLDLNKCENVRDFRRELNMKEGWYKRSFVAILNNGAEVKVDSTRLLSLDYDELGVINYEIEPLNRAVKVTLMPYLDSGITNEDTNWDDKFWDTLAVTNDDDQAFIWTRTMKTDFNVCTFMESKLFVDDVPLKAKRTLKEENNFIGFEYNVQISENQKVSLHKFAGYVVSLNHKNDDLIPAAKNVLYNGVALGFSEIKLRQVKAWEEIWKMADITIDGDMKAQQGIRFNIFQLNQTYLGKDARLNIGPKGFTGEKYGGSTYWDTEAYCIPFYLATKDQQVAKNLLVYRHNHLKKAQENAEKLGFSNGAALYPMVTMNGEESHNEWEITFEEIHRNGAIAYAIFNYTEYTGDVTYLREKGIDVLIGIARFWQQRASFSEAKDKFVILGVTGPNEYENNVNNNWYTNYIARWCIDYAIEQLHFLKGEFASDYSRVLKDAHLSSSEIEKWKQVADNLWFPYSEKHEVFLQQDGFLDKELKRVSELDPSQRPINQKWSWDRILRSPYIKQADVLQGFYFFEDDFSEDQHQKHFDFYEPFTVHESSLSPCVHSILAAKLGRMDQAYQFYLQTSRLDLDDYNKEVEEGCHITSMAGTWMSIVEGFGGMRVKNGTLSFKPQIPDHWKGYSFKVNFRGNILKVIVSHSETHIELQAKEALEILVNEKPVRIVPDTMITI